MGAGLSKVPAVADIIVTSSCILALQRVAETSLVFLYRQLINMNTVSLVLGVEDKQGLLSTLASPPWLDCEKKMHMSTFTDSSVVKKC